MKTGFGKKTWMFLNKNSSIDWEADFDAILSELNLFTKMVLTSAYLFFHFLANSVNENHERRGCT